MTDQPEPFATSAAAPTITEPVSRASVGLRSERGPVLLSVMLSTGLVALDATILATAVPAIVDDLGGLSQFPWLFSIYLLAQAAVVPIYGKLADLVGRKSIMLLGVTLFVVGSVLCGVAWSMPALIAFRAVQGLGAGAVQPMAVTIIGDIYSVAERAKVQGYVASVWAVSSVVGPTLGGLFVDLLNWRWIFFVNVPLGAVAAWILLRRFTEPPRPRRRHRIDYAGAVLIAAGSVLLVLGLLEGGQAWPWPSWQTALTLGGGVLLLLILVPVERHAAEPILPGWVFGARVFNGSNLVSLAAGASLIGLTSYIPLYVQRVLGHSALVAGLALGAMTLGWPLAAANSGRLYLRIGFRNTALCGCVAAIGGMAMLMLLRADSSVWYVALSCALVGLGLGLIVSPTLIAAQASVDWQRRGVVTGANMFARSIGSALGVAACGAIVNAVLNLGIGHPGTLDDVSAGELFGAIQMVMLAATIAMAVLIIGVLAMPRRVHEYREPGTDQRTGDKIVAAADVGSDGATPPRPGSRDATQQDSP